LRISILAWGSIVWDRRDLAIVADFLPAGPWLPIEFCRVSDNGRLTLVIDEDFGATCRTYSAMSVFDDLDAAIENLRDRENMRSAKGIGFTVSNGRRRSAIAVEGHPQAVKTITAWVNANGLDAAIWTALGNNFAEKTGGPFSVEAATRYFEMRNEKTLVAALRRRVARELRCEIEVRLEKARLCL
jgi:hypothetical protein